MDCKVEPQTSPVRQLSIGDRMSLQCTRLSDSARRLPRQPRPYHADRASAGAVPASRGPPRAARLWRG